MPLSNELDVFISHASEDKPTADAMCVLLEANGIRCWCAPRDIPHGAVFSGAIVDAIIEDVPLSKNMRLYIAQKHWLDALTPPLHNHLQTLLQTVRSYLGPAPTQIQPGEGSDLPAAFQSAIERNIPLGPPVGRALSRVERIEGRVEVQHFEAAPGFRCCLARAAGESTAYCVRGVIYENRLRVEFTPSLRP